MHDYIRTARKMIGIEAQAVSAVRYAIGASFVRAVGIILGCRGKVICVGIGKSGLIARKVAATLSATGTPAFFVCPSEAVHGDLGMISSDDIIIAFSHSGQTVEVLQIVPYLKQIGAPLIVITSNGKSELARQATITLRIRVRQEACPLGISPTASAVAMLAMGDALAMTLMNARGFTRDDYAARHPGGSLGRSLSPDT